MDLASAVPIIIPGPCVDAMADRGMDWMTTPVALPRIGIQLGAASRKVFNAELVTSPPVRMVAHPKALLACLARDNTDDWGAIVGIGAVAFALIGPSAWWVGGIAMGRTFFPRRFGTIHPPQRRCRPWPPSAPCRSGWFGCAAAACEAVCATAPTRAPGGPSAPPWQSLAAAAPVWPVVGEFLRRRSLSAAYRSSGTPDNGRRESGPEPGTTAALCCRSAGSANRLGGGAAPTTSGKRYRRVTP